MRSKKFYGLIAVIIAVSMLSGMMINQLTSSQVKTTDLTTRLMYIGTIHVVVKDTQGNVIKDTTSVHEDPLTNTGSSYIISAISNTTLDGAANKAVYLGLSNDSTPLVTWTTLPTLIAANGLSITAALTPTYGWCQTASGTSRYMILTNTFTDTPSPENVVQCAGVYYVSTGASGLVCANTFSSCNLIATDTIAVTYNITMPCG